MDFGFGFAFDGCERAFGFGFGCAFGLDCGLECRGLKEAEESTLLHFFKGIGGEVRLRVCRGLVMHFCGGGRGSTAGSAAGISATVSFSRGGGGEVRLRVRMGLVMVLPYFSLQVCGIL